MNRISESSVGYPLIQEAALLTLTFGTAAEHITIIGGLVPHFLVPDPPAHVLPHAATRDIDFSLTVALAEGDLPAYQNLESGLRELNYETPVKEERWRWERWRDNRHFIVEFLCPTVRGHGSSQYSPRGVGNLSAMPMTAAALASIDRQSYHLDIDLPDRLGHRPSTLRVAGLGAWLALKTQAIHGRSRDKDAADVVWILDAWEDGPKGAARTVKSGPVYGHPIFKSSMELLERHFTDENSWAARAHARESRKAGAGDNEDSLSTRAITVVKAFLAAI